MRLPADDASLQQLAVLAAAWGVVAVLALDLGGAGSSQGQQAGQVQTWQHSETAEEPNTRKDTSWQGCL